MSEFFFVHGWGYSPAFWQGLAPLLADDENTDHRIDLGFLVMPNPQESSVLSGTSPKIYITHSLGTLHALEHYADHMSALVIINGFYDFRAFVSDKVLAGMARGLERSPLAQMQAFWRQCGLVPEFEELGAETLRDGLETLRSCDMRGALDTLDIPVLCLAAEDDPITPYAAMADHWRGFSLISSARGGHILPHTRPDWCAAQIKDFIREHKLEY